MKHFLTIILFFSFFQIVAQDKIPKLTLSFKNTELKKALSQIEEVTDYSFFYLDKWISNKQITSNFDNVSINVILDEVFKNTDINFYISSDNKIILTRNVLIRETLPEGFFDQIEEETIKKEEEVKPILYNEEVPTVKTNVKTVRIGKEKRNSKQKIYTLSGYVLNSTTNKPIANLTLSVESKNINAITDEKGFYSLELPQGINTIITQSIGIEGSEKNVIIYGNGKLNFALKESAEALEEVIVEAEVDKNVKETVAGITQIKVESIKNIPLVLGERDILKVATSLPGISKAGEGSTGYNVRGGKEDQNLILLDDAVIYNPTHFFGIFSALNPFTTGDVDIYKGNIPAEYGGRLSSVFDISTKKGNTKNFSGEVSVGPVTSNITLETPIVKDKSSLIVGGRGTYSDWILKSLDEKSLNNSQASFYDVIAKYHHQINDNNSIKATGYFSDDKFSITSDSLYSYNNRLFSFRWNHKFNEKNNGSLIFANSQYKFNIEFDGQINNDFNLGYEVNETELKFKMGYKYNDEIKFNYGIASKLYVTYPGSIKPNGTGSIIVPLSIPKEKGLESAAFVSGRFDVTENLSIDAGARYSFYAFLGETSQRIYEEGIPRSEGTLIEVQEFDNNEVVKSYGNPEVRLSSRYLFSPSFSVKASFNSSYQYIHTLSSTTTVSPTDTWKLSDLNIKPQQANQFALGFYKNFEENMYEVSLEGYYKKSKNILDYKVGAQLLLNETLETEVLQGDGKSYGIEFLLKKDIGRLNGWLGYTYSRSFIKLDSEFNEERVNNGDFFPANYDKPHDFSLVANYKLTKRFSLSTNFAYQTGRPVTYPVGSYTFNNAQFVLYSDRNKFRIPDYYRLDIGFNVEGNHRIKKFAHSFWNISIYNVLGRNNPYSVFFVTEDGQLKAKQSSIFSIPIPTITYNFKF